MASEFPDLRTFFSSGSMVDAVLNMGMPAPIDVQVSSPDLHADYTARAGVSQPDSDLPGVGEVYIPQDMNYPALAAERGPRACGRTRLTQKEIVDNVITALNSNYMIAPNYWVDHKTGNDYFLTVQYYENGTPADSQPRGSDAIFPFATRPSLKRADDASDSGGETGQHDSDVPTEMDHYQIQRVADVYVTPAGEDLGKVSDADSRPILANSKSPENVRINLRGMVQG